MQATTKCKLAVCICPARANSDYCSEYCRQASSQGAERNFCQCGHCGCSKPAHAPTDIDTAGLPESISFAPGAITIEYTNRRDLRNQLILLAARLQAEIASETRSRLPARSETLKKSARTASG